jgi:hypothetical protein
VPTLSPAPRAGEDRAVLVPDDGNQLPAAEEATRI